MVIVMVFVCEVMFIVGDSFLVFGFDMVLGIVVNLVLFLLE